MNRADASSASWTPFSQLIRCPPKRVKSRRVASFTSSARPAADDERPSIRSDSDSRVRIDAGTLFATGCLLAGAGGNRHRFVNPQRGCTPTKFSSKSRTSPPPMAWGKRQQATRTRPMRFTRVASTHSSAARYSRRMWVRVLIQGAPSAVRRTPSGTRSNSRTIDCRDWRKLWRPLRSCVLGVSKFEIFARASVALKRREYASDRNEVVPIWYL